MNLLLIQTADAVILKLFNIKDLKDHKTPFF